MDWSRENILAIALGLSVYLYKADTCKTELLLETDNYDDYPSSLAWSNDGRTLAVGFSTSRIEVWDAVSRQLVVYNVPIYNIFSLIRKISVCYF